ncbi:Acetyl-hydrolase [Phytophthora palmivora]|uniref:Acetyl-hydrolase n=1 Tax=Phytophthora palmivora TaxID=4796 RepID=A0A2P4XWT1_9STRA|nr:Acetyl-hydrolase [Phytophthora palmivora]
MVKQDYVVSTSQRLDLMKDSKIKIKETEIAVARRSETVTRNKIDRIQVHHLSDARSVGRANIAIFGAEDV